MTDTLKVEFDISRWTALAAGLPPSAMQNAWRRTLRKTMTWVRSQVAREVSGATKIPQKVIRERLYFFLRSAVTGKVWLGLNAIEADRLGATRQTRTGVTAGRFRFPGAWVYRSRYSDGGAERRIKIRRSDGSIETKHYYSSDANAGKVFRRVGRARTPYERVKFDWSQGGEAVFNRVADRARERLMTILEQEVNYEIQKATGRA